MTKPDNQAHIDRQYLKAMGIDLWTSRENGQQGPQSTMSSTTSSTMLPTELPPEASTGPPVGSDSIVKTNRSVRPLVEFSTSEITAAISSFRINCDEPIRNAECLVLTEDPELNDQSRSLLGSMFKAIELDASGWLQANLQQTGDGQSLVDFAQGVNPGAVVLMLNSGGGDSALDHLRGLQLRVPEVPWFAVASYHPQNLLDNPSTKRPAWEDLKQLRQWLS